MPKPQKPKLINWQIIDRNHNTDIYDILDNLVSLYHPELENCSIIVLLMWRHNWKLDVDNYLKLVDISKTPDKYRELVEHDFIIGLNKESWGMIDDAQKKTIIDSQLERIAISLTKDGELKEDDRSRTIYRLKRIETSQDNILRRHNTSLSNVIDFVVSRIGTVTSDPNKY